MPTEDEVVAALARDRGRALVGCAALLTGSVKDAEDRTGTRRPPGAPSG